MSSTLELAERLHLSRADAVTVSLLGVGDQEIPGYLMDREFQLGRYRWTAPAIFSAGVQAKAILGQIGFSHTSRLPFDELGSRWTFDDLDRDLKLGTYNRKAVQ